jgi:fumarylacetoacetase
MHDINETHARELTSHVATANEKDTDFPIQNLPFGSFRRLGTTEEFRCGVAIGDQVLDLGALQAAGCLEPGDAALFDTFKKPQLNAFMACGAQSWSRVRLVVSRLLRSGAPQADAVKACLVPMAQVENGLPAAIGDYSDFFASEQHARNMTAIMAPGAPLMPNFKWLPIAYHGRASSIELSGTHFPRPLGQGRLPGEEHPTYGPVRWLDYEVEFGLFVGPGNKRGEPVALKDAESQLFGVCLLNDWSARDVQGWESMPLGPFLAKSFISTISPWVVTLEALAPFRCAQTRADSDHPSFPYLQPDAAHAQRIALDIQLEAWLQQAGAADQGTQLSHTSSRHAYWAPAQMLAHHTENGCNLRPGDLLGSGTQSGPQDGEQGCLMERSLGGKRPLNLNGGGERTFLLDGDTVVLKGYCVREGYARIGFGECRGTVQPALPC